MEKQLVYICVDAGGTSSKVALFDKNKNILKRTYGKTGSPAVAYNEWYLNIDEAIEELYSQIDLEKYQIVKIQMGISGISALSNINFFKEFFENKYKVKCDLISDTMTALYSILEKNEETGIIVIAGTGVAVFGKNHDKTRLIGGWGHIIRERGSSYSIVHDFCVELIDKYEECIPFDELDNAFLEYVKLDKVRDLNHLFYQNSKDDIAKNSIFFKIMANKNNQRAIHLLEVEGAHLAKQVIDLMKILNLENGTSIALTGGLIDNDGKYVIKGFNDYLLKNDVSLNIKECKDQLYGVFNIATK